MVDDIDLPETHCVNFGAVFFGGFDRRSRQPSFPEIRKRIVSSLEKDARVVRVVRSASSDVGGLGVSFFPRLEDHDFEPVVLTEKDAGLCPRFYEPIVFEISIPPKNQPSFGLNLPPPPSLYAVAWDGNVYVCLWDQPKDHPIPFAAGVVVRELILEAIKEAGFIGRGQGPSPAHETWRITYSRDVSQPAITRSNDPFGLTCTMPGIAPPHRNDEAALGILLAFRLGQWEFYELENIRERFVATVGVLGGDLERLQRSQYEATKKPDDRFVVWHWARGLWPSTRRRAEARHTIARIWLTLTRLQSISAEWHLNERSYLEEASRWGEPLIFERDYRRASEDIARFDPSHALNLLEHVSGRLDNVSLIVTTAASALIGGVVGALAAHFIGR